MTETERITDQLNRAYAGNAWHGPSLSEALSGLTAQQAATRIVPNAHTIWEIVRHLLSGYRVVYMRLQGDRADITEEEDWPKVVDESENNWQQDVATLNDRHKELMAQLSSVTDGALNDPIVENYASIYRTLHGHIQHVLYHTGQIAILKKAMQPTPVST